MQRMHALLLRAIGLMLALATATGVPTAVAAQDYPTKPVRDPRRVLARRHQ